MQMKQLMVNQSYFQYKCLVNHSKVPIPIPQKITKKTVKTALGRSKLSPVQMSGKSDKSTHESPPITLKIMKKHILGKSELSTVKKSGKSDTSKH